MNNPNLPPQNSGPDYGSLLRRSRYARDVMLTFSRHLNFPGAVTGIDTRLFSM